MIIKYYSALIYALLGWTEPFFSSLIIELNKIFSFHLHLLPHWRHIFVLLCIYFFRVALVNYSYGYKRTGYFVGIWGFLIATITSILIGSVPLKGLIYQDMIIMSLIVILSIFLFDLGRQLWITTFSRKRIAIIYREPIYPWWGYLRPNLLLITMQAIGSIAFVSICLLIPIIKNSKSPLLLSLGLLIIAIAIYRVCLGVLEVPRLRKKMKLILIPF